ncbi:S1C family serine protease [Piscinibacter koreensis]|uniref:Serine protease n=1 Tax=Piscinibacter koreensis TaxID=2742824 RepID=A0A7Y6NLR7_9BURK|nr:S1C family serine protease [Schlegelella koreensis]NUZ05444.1 serine protease [Schlegelella koreensis]
MAPRTGAASRAWRIAAWLLAGLAVLLAAPLAAQTLDTAAVQAQQTEARTRALERASHAVVGVETLSIDDAPSAATLGRARIGSGVVIGDDDLVLTIGYLIVEAERVDLVDGAGRRVPARVVAYDVATGFGLLQALAPLALAPAPLGDAAALVDGEPLLVASGGQIATLGISRLVSRRPFSGYWEYHIDDALFTAPARVDHSGAGLFNADGELLGIGSLVVADATGIGAPGLRGNMFVPVDLLKPILAELRVRGASAASRRAWLGVNCIEADDHLRVIRVAEDSPAERAGLRVGDEILGIDGSAATTLHAFYTALWQRGVVREVELRIRRADAERTIRATTADRLQTFKRPQGV